MITDQTGLHSISSIAIIYMYRLVLTGFIAYLLSTQALLQPGWCFHQCRYHRDKAQPQVADCLLAPVPPVSLQPLCFLGMLLPNQQLCAGPLRAVHENNTTRLLDLFTLDCFTADLCVVTQRSFSSCGEERCVMTQRMAVKKSIFTLNCMFVSPFQTKKCYSFGKFLFVISSSSCVYECIIYYMLVNNKGKIPHIETPQSLKWENKTVGKVN